MQILVATNYFKGSLSALRAANIIKEASESVDNSVCADIIPIADGGDGTLDSINHCCNTTEIYVDVLDPLQREIKAKWLLLFHNNKRLGVIEAAQANGLSLLKPSEYNPLITTSYGVGQLIKSALDYNCDEIILTVGGSSTNDAGAGLLQALGIIFFEDNFITSLLGGINLLRVSHISLDNLDERLFNCKIKVACDVVNPLYGLNGASYVYAPQKGASKKEVILLDKALTYFASLTRDFIGFDYAMYESMGAAGGIPFAMKAFLNADIVSGFDFIADIADLEQKISNSDLVITTEGRFDLQSLQGKATYKLAKIANKYNKPVILIAGSIDRNIKEDQYFIKALFSLADGPIKLQDSLDNAEYLLSRVTKQLVNTLLWNQNQVEK